jgi:hypothetical protein
MAWWVRTRVLTAVKPVLLTGIILVKFLLC